MRWVACWLAAIALAASFSNAQQIAAGGFHTCWITADRTIRCVGSNSNGQLNAPLGQFLTIDAQDDTTCAINTALGVKCFGRDAYGVVSKAPASVQMTHVSVGNQFACGVRRNDSRVQCWGTNLPAYRNLNAPPTQAKSICSGQFFSCAIDLAGGLFCWCVRVPTASLAPVF